MTKCPWFFRKYWAFTDTILAWSGCATSANITSTMPVLEQIISIVQQHLETRLINCNQLLRCSMLGRYMPLGKERVSFSSNGSWHAIVLSPALTTLSHAHSIALYRRTDTQCTATHNYVGHKQKNIFPVFDHIFILSFHNSKELVSWI